jgi:hypothetical protein
MKTIVTQQKIIFQHRFYSLEIPKQDNLRLNFDPFRGKIGMPAGLEVIADNKRLIANLFGKVVYFYTLFMCWYSNNLKAWIAPELVLSPTAIVSEKAIENFMVELKDNGYEIKILNKAED